MSGSIQYANVKNTRLEILRTNKKPTGIKLNKPAKNLLKKLRYHEAKNKYCEITTHDMVNVTSDELFEIALITGATFIKPTDRTQEGYQAATVLAQTIQSQKTTVKDKTAKDKVVKDKVVKSKPVITPNKKTTVKTDQKCDTVPELIDDQAFTFGQQQHNLKLHITNGYDTDSDEHTPRPDHWLGFNRYKTKKYLKQQFDQVHFS
jgi:hypothetical protein